MSSSNSNDEVRTTPLWLAPFQSIGREFAVILQNTRAFTGGVIGSLALSAGLAALVLIGNAKADEADEESEMLDIEFVPGALVRLGEKRDEKIPEKLIIEETVAAEEVAEETITKDEKTPPPPETKKKDDIKETKEKGKVPPDPNKKDAKVSDKNRDKNTPHNDLPTVKDLPGDPFGSADGWADMAKEGDPWATSVIGVLNKMKVPSFAAESKSGSLKFQIEICANGTIKEMRIRQKSADPKLDAAVKAAVEATKIPAPPANVAKQLAGGCKTIPYRFTWSGGGKVE
jgi:TonB family protein